MLACKQLSLAVLGHRLTSELQCVARKVPELCKAYTPGKTDQDIHLRIQRLEKIIEAALPQYWTSSSLNPSHDSNGHLRQQTPGADDDTRSQPDDEDPSGGFFETGKWYGTSASSIVSAPVVLQKVPNILT